MADVDKITFKSPIVISVLIGAVTMTAAVLKGHFETNSKIDRLSAKFDVYIASQISDKVIMNYRVSELEKIKKQVKISAINIKTLADIIKQDKINLTEEDGSDN